MPAGQISHTVEKIKLSVGDLRPGMYVCALDKPWVETPFSLQGFEVKDIADIKAVMLHCQHVYVDFDRSNVVEVTIDEVPGRYFQSNAEAARSVRDYEFAQATHRQTSDLVNTLVDGIALGKSPDTQLAFGAVSECVASVMRNAEAAMLLTRLQGKNENAGEHATNVCIYSILVGRLLGLQPFKLENLGIAALLHDIGMMAIPQHVANKLGMFNAEEMAIMQTHAKWGRDILMSGRNIYSGAVDVAHSHHENIDGSGYPRGLNGDQLNLNCKIVAVADKYASIISPMSYRPAGDHLSALNVLNTLAKQAKIDAEITSRFVSYLGIYPPGCIVELSSGEVGIVLEANVGQRLRPQILVVRSPRKEPTRRLVDLAKTATDACGRPYRIVSVRQAGDFGIDAGHYHSVVMQSCA